MKKIVIFASGSGTNAENIIKYFEETNTGTVAAVFTNNPNAQVIDKAKKYGVTIEIFSKEQLFESEVLQKINAIQPDWIVLAGFLLKFPQKIIAAYPNKIINIHPALLPKYGGKGMYGMNIHKAIVENKEKETGITIHYVNEEELKHFRKIQLLSGYIDERKQIIDSFNNATGADRSLPLNGRNFTNMGLFRKYVELYLKNHPQVHQELLLLVRQLAPTAQGLPLELYLFTATTSWTEYENIMSDIFDHVTAAVPYFGLEIFEDVSNPLRMSSAKTDTEKMPVPVKK